MDGVIALCKLYSPQDLSELTSTFKVQNYQWVSGKKDNGRGGKIVYLKGEVCRTVPLTEKEFL
jgi:hypothetical protein